MNILTLVHNLPTATLVAWALANAAPYLSAWLTRNPGWYAGALTLLLTTLDGVVAEWVRAGDNWNWKAALGQAAVAYVVALVHQVGLLRNTSTADKLHRKGPQLGDPRDDDKLLPVSAA